MSWRSMAFRLVHHTHWMSQQSVVDVDFPSLNKQMPSQFQQPKMGIHQGSFSRERRNWTNQNSVLVCPTLETRSICSRVISHCRGNDPIYRWFTLKRCMVICLCVEYYHICNNKRWANSKNRGHSGFHGMSAQKGLWLGCQNTMFKGWLILICP